MNNIKVYKAKGNSKQSQSSSETAKAKSFSHHINSSSSGYSSDHKLLPRPIESKKSNKTVMEEVTESNIEQILIEIYNHYIKCCCTDIQPQELSRYKNEVRALAQTFDDKCNVFILKTLLGKIKELIGRYKDKIYEIIEVNSIKETVDCRNKTPEHSISRELFKKYTMNSFKKKCLRLKTFTRKGNDNSESCNKETIKTIFTELVNVKLVLIKSSKDIEEIFKYAKSEFNEFCFEQCQREEYLRVIVKDDFIQYLIQNNRDCELKDLIEEIEEDKRKNMNQMTFFTETLRNYKPKEAKCKSLSLLNCFKPSSPVKVEECGGGSSKTSHLCFDDLLNFITGDNVKEQEKDKKVKKAKKRKKKWQKEKASSTEKESSEESSKEKESPKECCVIEKLYCDVIEGFKSCLNKASITSSKCQKIKSTISDDWVNKLKSQCDYSKAKLNNNP